MIKKSKIYLLMIFMSSVFMISCVEEIVFDTGDFESELVVNALFNPQSPWSVHISNTTNILDNSTKISNITNAKVEIYDQNGNSIYELEHLGNGIYGKEDYAPSPKRGYSIKVSAPGYHPVTATSFVPEKSKLVINNVLITPNEDSDDVEVDFEIEDRSKLESYYIWEIVSIEKGDEGGSVNDPLSKTWIDELKNKSNTLVSDSREILGGTSFGDGTYNGTYNSTNGNRIVLENNDPRVNYEHDVTFLGKVKPNINLPDEINQNGYVNEVEDEEGGKVEVKYELRVMSISKELFDYYSSVEEYIKFSNSNSSEGFPYKIYTNVDHGYGIFAGYSESVIQF